MAAKNKKSRQKINLLNMSDPEKIKILRELRQNLRQKIIEAKLWQSLIEAETVTINGNKIFLEQDSLKGLQITNGAHFK